MSLTKLAAGAALAIGLMGAGAASAAVTYSYVGNQFTDVTAPITTDHAVSGFFTVDEALAPGTISSFSTVTFEFSAGAYSFSSTESNIFINFFDIIIGSSGEVTGWYIDIFKSDQTRVATFSESVDANDVVIDLVSLGYGSNANNPGSWTKSTTPTAVPEPTTWALLMAGFGLTGAALRQVRRRTSLAAKRV